MGIWDELTKAGFGKYIPVCERLDRQWIIDCLERDKFWEWLIHHAFQKSYQKWKNKYNLNVSYEAYMAGRVGNDWETDYFWYLKRLLVVIVLPRLSKILHQRFNNQSLPKKYDAVDLLHRLSNRLLTAVIYLCIRNNLCARDTVPPTGQSDSNLFYSLFDRTKGPWSGNGAGNNNLSMVVCGTTFNASDVGMPVEFSGGSGNVDRTIGFITSVVDEYTVTLDCIIPTSSNLDVITFYHPKHENAKALVAGFAESYQGTTKIKNMRIRLNALQHAAIYVNESEYDKHTIRWNQHKPNNTMHCDIYKLDFGNYSTPPTATKATTSFAGKSFNYTTKMIAMQYETIQNSGIHTPTNKPLLRSDFQNFGEDQAYYDQNGRPHVERLLSNAVRLSSAYHHPTGKAYVEAKDGVCYAFTWTEYFGFAWVPWNQLTDADDNADELKRPIDFLPPIPDDFEISEDELLDRKGDANGSTKNDRNHPHTGTDSRTGDDLVGNKHAAVTWHWTAGKTLHGCTKTLGRKGTRKAEGASVNFGLGKAFKKYDGKQSGIMRYAGVDRVTNHAGVGVERRINGAKSTSNKHKTSWNSVGIETCNVGYARIQGKWLDKDKGIKRTVRKTTHAAKPDWLYIIPKNGGKVTNWRTWKKGSKNNPKKRDWWRIEPWPPEQIAMAIYLGKHIVSQLPHITMRDHHGHHDTCPQRKVDIIGFPFARVLRCVYPDEIVPDVWSQFVVSVNRGNGRRTTYQSRQTALLQFNYDMKSSIDEDECTHIAGVDGGFGTNSKLMLKNFKTNRNSFRQELRDGNAPRKNNVPVNIRDIESDSDRYYWCTFTCWEIHDAMVEGWVKP